MAWNIVNKAITNNAGPSTPATIAVPSTSSGNTLIILVGGSTNSVTITSVSDGSTNFAQLTGALATDSSGGNFTDIWYLSNSAAGKTTITVNVSSGITFYNIYYYEVSGLLTSGAGDKGAGTNNGNDSAGLAVGPSVTPTYANAFVCAIYDGGAVNNLKGGSEFILDDLTSTSGTSHIISNQAAASAHSITWATSSSTFCASIGAFFANSKAPGSLLMMFR